jgi:hypothetical protein
LQHRFHWTGIAVPAFWAAGEYLYRWKATRLRFRRHMLRLWPLWLALLAINLAEGPARRWLDGAGAFYALWNRLHVMGLGLAGAAAVLIMTGLLIEAYIATSAHTKRLPSSLSSPV